MGALLKEVSGITIRDRLDFLCLGPKRQPRQRLKRWSPMMSCRPNRNQLGRSGPIRWIFAIACLTALLVAGYTSAGDEAKKEETAKSKAAVEEKAAVQGVKASPADAITKGEAQAVDPAGKERLDDAITCLARTIYWEGRNSNAADMEAVACVVMNRLGHEGFPSTVCGIVKQGQEQHACQFSWWCDGRPDAAQNDEAYGAAKEIARRALNKELKDQTGGAMYFHGKGSTPDWAGKYIRTVAIDGHVFYKPGGNKAK
jgi:spore germination cell wall hydrolase CwlJ-like protein